MSITLEEYLNLPDEWPEIRKVGDKKVMEGKNINIRVGDTVYWMEIKSLDENNGKISVQCDVIDGEADPTLELVDREETIKRFDKNQEINKIQLEAMNGIYKTDWLKMREYFIEFLDKTKSKVIIMDKPTAIGMKRKPIKALTRKCKTVEGSPVEDMLYHLDKEEYIYIYFYNMSLTPSFEYEGIVIDPAILIRYATDGGK
jgi:hypothetical protein